MEIDIRTIITGIFLAIGCFLLIVASIGVLRLPDFYTRMHAAGKTDTLGQTFILLGLVIYAGFSLVSIKLLIIIGLIYIINPTATHFLAKAAYVRGVKPWFKDQGSEVEACYDESCYMNPAREAAAAREEKLSG